jgi:PAS domain S-box-containing protein
MSTWTPAQPVSEAPEAVRSGERFFELSRDLLCVHRSNGALVRTNHAWEVALGRSGTELVGANLLDLVHPDDAPLVQRALDPRPSLSGQRVRVDLRFPTADGSVRWIQWSSVYDETDGLFYGAGRDITEEHEARDRLRDSEQRYRELFESHPVPMAIWDPETLEIIDANDAALRQYGYTLEEIKGLTIDRLVDRADWPRLLSRISQLPVGIAGGEIFKHRRKDGSLIDVEVTGHALEYGGRFARVVMALDVTNHGRRQDDPARDARVAGGRAGPRGARLRGSSGP